MAIKVNVEVSIYDGSPAGASVRLTYDSAEAAHAGISALAKMLSRHQNVGMLVEDMLKVAKDAGNLGESHRS